MARNISFALTTEQIKNRNKTVTRRSGWHNLQPGERLWAVEKAQGLKRGEKITRLALIEIVAVSTEPLNAITADDVIKEGFADMSKDEFIEFFCKSHKNVTPDTNITIIEFCYVGDKNDGVYFQCCKCKHTVTIAEMTIESVCPRCNHDDFLKFLIKY